jgi:hypothetical protein
VVEHGHVLLGGRKIRLRHHTCIETQHRTRYCVTSPPEPLSSPSGLESSKTTKVYDRPSDQITLDKIERIAIWLK